MRAFLAIAKAGQIGDAAHRLGVDPTTLGHRLKRLEAYHDISLLERTRVGQTLTKAEPMEQAARSIDESLGARQGIAGTLRLSVSMKAARITGVFETTGTCLVAASKLPVRTISRLPPEYPDRPIPW